MAKNDSAKILAEKPVRGSRVGTIHHSAGYEFGEDGMVKMQARKGNANYETSGVFEGENPDFEAGHTQNVGTPVQSDGLRNAISHIRGK